MKIIKITLVCVGALILFLIISLVSKSSVTFVIDSNSPIKEGAELRLSKDNYENGFSLPHTDKFRFGKYTYKVTAKGANIEVQDFRVWPPFNRKIVISLPEADFPGARTVVDMPFLSLFPHYDTNFKIEISVDDLGEINILTITPFVSPVDNSETFQDLRARRDEYVAEANKWLSENQIPPAKKVIIDSPY